uniref:Uncharacterized protein n=1 Tax=Anguilla anguilla TaxID=7936 RepID=A0A0E9RB09_ANGAN
MGPFCCTLAQSLFKLTYLVTVPVSILVRACIYKFTVFKY